MVNKSSLSKCTAVAAIIIMFLLSFSACTSESDGAYVFNKNIEALDTRAEGSHFEVELILSPEWGSEKGQVGSEAPEQESSYPEFTPVPFTFEVDSQGRIYIDDMFNKRVSVFNYDGSHLLDYPYPTGSDVYEQRPAGLAASQDGRVYYVQENGNITGYDIEGNIIWQSNLREDNRSYDPRSASVGPDGNLYFSGEELYSKDESLIKEFDRNCNFIEEVVLRGPSNDVTLDGKVLVDGEGNFYKGILGVSNSELHVFDHAGNQISKIYINDYEGRFGLLGIDKAGNLYCWSDYYDEFSEERNGMSFYKYRYSDGALMAVVNVREDDFEDPGFLSWPSAFRDDGSLYFMYVPMDRSSNNLRIYRIML